MANRFTTTENQIIETLLKKVPRGVVGILPYKEFEATNEWNKLKQNHPEGSIRARMSKIWKESVIPIKATEEKKDTHLNHAYNFCPGCGMKLN